MSKRTKTNNPKPVNFYIITLIIFCSVIILIFNDFGLLQLIRLQQQETALDNSLTVLLLQQEKLRSEISKLQTDREYIEKIAREKFMMVVPGEKVYRVQEIKQY